VIFVADDDVPGADFPLFRKAVEDVRIFAGEGLNFALVIDVKNKQCAVDRFCECARESEFSAFAGFAGEAQVFFSEGGAARDHVFNEFVE